MDIFIARQPIFDKNMKVIAYELLYRSGKVNAALSGGDSATSSVIINGLLMIGLETLTDKKKAFVNFTRNLLVDETATVFPSDSLVVEVLEDVESDPLLLESLKRLKKAGYTIALDDYVESYVFEDIVALADIIKVDFLLCDMPAISRIAKRFKGSRVRLLAEKVETQEQFDKAAALGYTYFQGYFFAKPNIVASKDMQGIKVSHVRILKELGTPDPDFAKISSAIESDLALTYKLLKLVNSAAYHGTSQITSIQQALVRLGMKEVRKWTSLIMMRDAGENKPEELVRASLVRARAMETLAVKVKLGGRKTEFFLLGIFSMIDVIMDRPLADILEELPLDDEIKKALLGDQNKLRKGLEIIIAYERADWDTLEQLAGIGQGMTDDMLIDSYFDAIKWTQELYDL